MTSHIKLSSAVIREKKALLFVDAAGLNLNFSTHFGRLFSIQAQRKELTDATLDSPNEVL